MNLIKQLSRRNMSSSDPPTNNGTSSPVPSRQKQHLPQESARSPTRSPSRSPCLVSFGKITSSPVPKRTSYTDAERKSLWYNGKELRKLRKQVDKVVQHKEELDESEDCWRGLEYWSAQSRRLEAGEQLQSKTVMLSLMQASHDAKKKEAKDKKKKIKIKRTNSKDKSKVALSLEDCKDLEGLGAYLNGEAIQSADMRANQDLAEAYSIYLETMNVEEVNACFGMDSSSKRSNNGYGAIDSSLKGDNYGSSLGMDASSFERVETAVRPIRIKEDVEEECPVLTVCNEIEV